MAKRGGGDVEQALRVKLIIRLCGGEDGRGFGPGVMTLMEQVAEKKSLRSAAARQRDLHRRVPAALLAAVLVAGLHERALHHQLPENRGRFERHVARKAAHPVRSQGKPAVFAHRGECVRSRFLP